MAKDIKLEFTHFISMCLANRSTVDAKRFVEINKGMLKWFARNFGAEFWSVYRNSINSFKATHKDLDIDMVELEKDISKTINSKK